MGVYIKGMEMPKSCDVCTFSDWSNLHQTACCKILEYKPCFSNFSSEYRTRISDLCPLVEVSEPHGKLIDADEVLKEHCTESCRKKPSCEEDCIIYDMLHFSKTIIKAESNYG